jgi:iron complex transport system ATP-binding protein
MENNKPILTTSNLCVGYTSKKENKAIASNINLTLNKGELIALIGANGIGKSTLLRTLIGIQPPLSGTVILNDKNILDYDSISFAQNLSIVLTEKLPPSNLTVFEIIALGRQPYTNWLGNLSDNDISKINEAMELTQITSLANKKHYEIMKIRENNV